MVKDGGTYWTHIPHPEKIRVARNVQAAAAAAAKAPIVSFSKMKNKIYDLMILLKNIQLEG